MALNAEQRYVRTPEKILDCVLWPASKKNRKLLAEFKQWEDWPKETRNGYSVAEVRAFFARNAGNIKALNDLSNLGDELGKKTSKQDLANITASRIAQGAPDALPDDGSPVGNYNTQGAMADALQARYRGQIRYVVNRVVFNHWHHGRELSKGVPPPPGKRGNYYIGTEYCDWFERHILPQWKHNTDAQGVLLPDLTAKAQEAEAATKILNHQMAEHEWAVQQGKYILKERALNLVHGSVTVMRNLFRRAHETNIPLALAEWVKPKLSAEDWVAFREYHLAQERAAVDWLEGELERLGREGAQQVKREQN